MAAFNSEGNALVATGTRALRAGTKTEIGVPFATPPAVSGESRHKKRKSLDASYISIQHKFHRDSTRLNYAPLSRRVETSNLLQCTTVVYRAIHPSTLGLPPRDRPF